MSLLAAGATVRGQADLLTTVCQSQLLDRLALLALTTFAILLSNLQDSSEVANNHVTITFERESLEVPELTK